MLQTVWTAVGALGAAHGGAGDDAQLMARPGGTFTADEYAHIADHVLPLVREAMRGALSEETGGAGLALAAARALATRPCANPRCLKIEGCLEREARGKRCTGCMVSRYCCRECQVAGWRAHKKVCKELGAEREAAA
jgi:hypothetical protein